MFEHPVGPLVIKGQGIRLPSNLFQDIIVAKSSAFNELARKSASTLRLLNFRISVTPLDDRWKALLRLSSCNFLHLIFSLDILH